MILSSIINNDKYFWIKVPRTATVSYQNLFLKYYSGDTTCEEHDPATGNLHMHYSYTNLCKLYGFSLPGITVVRHPLTRFVSGIHRLKSVSKEKNIDCSFLDNTKIFVEYLKTFFGKNCHTTASFQDIFLSTEELFIKSFFQTQITFVYDPNVKWFWYENINQFNNWITSSLGYDITQLTRKNASKKELLKHLDFSNPELVKQVELMFYDDYKVFNYPMEYLT
jgi:hypothetical protein